MAIHFDRYEDYAEWLHVAEQQEERPVEAHHKQKRQQLERKMQMEFFDWVRRYEPQYKLLDWLRHIPNGPPHGQKAVYVLMHRMGVQRGPWDVECLLPRQGFNGAAAEFKTEVGDLSTDQVKWQGRYQRLGWDTQIFTSWPAAALYWIWYFDLPEQLREGLE